MMVISPQGPVDKPLEGVFLEMTPEEYRKAPGLNHSLLKAMAVNPLEFQYQLKNRTPTTPAMAIGLYVDWFLSSPGASIESTQFVIQPSDYQGNAKVWKEWKALNLAKDKVIVTQDVHTRALELLDVLKQKAVWPLIEKSKRQIPVFAVLKYAGSEIQVKCLIDLWPDGYIGNWDFKTSTDCNPEFWSKHVINLSYHTQAAWYCMICSLLGLKDKDSFFHIVLETRAPYHTMNHQLDNGFLNLGRKHLYPWLERYIDCEQKKEWPGYPEGINRLELPAWAKKELDYDNHQ